MLSCQYCEIFKNSLFLEQLRWLLVSSCCTIWICELLFTWIDVSCSFICSFIFVIFSSHERILILVGSFSWNSTRPVFSKFDQTKMFAVFDSLNLNKLIWPCISGFSYSDHSPPFINYYLFVSNGSFLLQSIKYLFSPLWLLFFRLCFLYLYFTEPQTKIYSGFFSCFSFFHVFLFFILVLLYFYSFFTWTASKIL